MKEKIIIRSEQYNLKKMLYGFFIAAAVVGLLIWFTVYNERFWDCLGLHMRNECKCKGVGCDENALICAIDECVRGNYILPFLLILPPVSGIAIFGLVLYLILKEMELVVTDKRIRGYGWFGQKIDLPMDSISAVGSCWFGSIAISTASGRILLIFIRNSREIHEEIAKLLIERQEVKL